MEGFLEGYIKCKPSHQHGRGFRYRSNHAGYANDISKEAVLMRNGNILLNLIIYYFILNLICSPFVFGFLHFYEKYTLHENQIIKALTIGILIGWCILLHVITYLSAKFSSYHGEGVEEAILEAFKKITIYVKLAFSFLGK